MYSEQSRYSSMSKGVSWVGRIPGMSYSEEALGRPWTHSVGHCVPLDNLEEVAWGEGGVDFSAQAPRDPKEEMDGLFIVLDFNFH